MATVITEHIEDFKLSLFAKSLNIPLVPINDFLIRIEPIQKLTQSFILEFRLVSDEGNFEPYRQIFEKDFVGGNVIIKSKENRNVKRVDIILSSTNGYKPSMKIISIRR